MNTSSERAERIAAHRRRYEELKAAGEGRAGTLTLPPASPLPAPQPPAAAVLAATRLPGGSYLALRMAPGERLLVCNPAGTPGVSLMCWNAEDPSERFNPADTVKIQWTARLQRGRLLLSDMGRVLCALVEDSCGAHDTLLGGSTASAGACQDEQGNPRHARENLMLAALKLGLQRADLGPVLTLFAPVVTDPEGRFTWDASRLRAGDYVELRAEMPLLLALSNTPHPLAPVTAATAGAGCPPAIELVHWQGPPASAEDPCRCSGAEARRAYENTDAYLHRGLAA